MGIKETNLRRQYILKAAEKGYYLWNFNSASGWQGRCGRTAGGIYITNPQPLRAGLVNENGDIESAPDLLGFKVVTVTEGMVGQQIAIFAGAEIKAGKDVVSKKQKKFLTFLKKMGCNIKVIRDGCREVEV